MGYLLRRLWRGSIPMVAPVPLPNLRIFARVSDIPDVSKFALRSELPAAPDLSMCALKSDLPTGELVEAADLAPLLAWKEEVGDPKLLARRSDLPDVSEFALKRDIPAPPDLSQYALKSEVAPPADLSAFVHSSEIEDLLAQKDLLIRELRHDLAQETSRLNHEIERLEALIRELYEKPTTVIPGTISSSHKAGRNRARTPDDLESITGIGPVLAQRLHAMGVSSLSQIAQWTEEDVKEFQAKLETVPDRIHREKWVEQAQRLQDEKAPGEIRPLGLEQAG